MTHASEPLISAIRVTKLFGLYTYSLPNSGSFSNASILYGDNGVGKSTILRLAFHLLSAAGDRGHRTALYKNLFDRIEVDLASGVAVTASHLREKNADSLEMCVSKSGKPLAVWNYKPRSHPSEDMFDTDNFEIIFTAQGEPQLIRRPKTKKTKQTVPTGEKAFLAALQEHMPTVFILNAERRLDSDSVPDPSDEMELRKVMHFKEPKHINDLVVRSREIALSQALSTAAKWIARNAVVAANQGSVNVQTVYVNVLRHLTAPSSNRSKAISTQYIEDLVNRLVAIEKRTKEFSGYKFETPLITEEFQTALHVEQKGKSQIVAHLLEPYIESTEGRLQALEPIYRTTDRFVSTVNSFLSDKTLSYTLSHGFLIQNALQKDLEPARLSSGEQQLLLLFCYVLTRRDEPSVFMIDEPELSLNIKWQRQLIQSLLDITEGTRIQFIFASHSLELLSQHRDRVVKLTDLP